jgi:hypothetical protein
MLRYSTLGGHLSQASTLVIMGPGVRRDDDGRKTKMARKPRHFPYKLLSAR